MAVVGGIVRTRGLRRGGLDRYNYEAKNDPRAPARMPVPLRLLHAVVGCFLGDDDVVDVGFAEAGGGDTDEAALLG